LIRSNPREIKDIKITETHPRALLKAMDLNKEPWSAIAGKFDFDGLEN
jgi:hypothetical protein